MNNLDLDFENLELPTDKTLAEKAVELAYEALAIQQQIDDYEEDLKALKARLRQLLDVELPNIMEQDARDHVVLENGYKVTLKDVVSATMPKDELQRKAFFAWLSDHDATDIIKSEIKMTFGKSQHNEALDLAHTLTEQGHSVSVTEGIHTQTLNKFVRERLQSGEELPEKEVLPIYAAKVAKFDKR